MATRAGPGGVLRGGSSGGSNSAMIGALFLYPAGLRLPSIHHSSFTALSTSSSSRRHGTVFPWRKRGQCHYDRLCDAQGTFSCRGVGTTRDLTQTFHRSGPPGGIFANDLTACEQPRQPTPSLKMGESPAIYRRCRPAGPPPTREYADSPSHYPPQADP